MLSGKDMNRADSTDNGTDRAFQSRTAMALWQSEAHSHVNSRTMQPGKMERQEMW